MEELKLLCDTEIPIRQKSIATSLLYFQKSLESTKTKSQETVQNQVKLGKLKAQLRDVEDDLVKALAVKTRKEAKRMSMADSIAATKVRTEELKRINEDRRAKRDEYAAIISRQAGGNHFPFQDWRQVKCDLMNLFIKFIVEESAVLVLISCISCKVVRNIHLSACEEKRDKDAEGRGEVEEAISWYNKVLGFRIECGHGVKFIFTNINLKNPTEEYSFTIRHENNIYTLLDCDPHLNDTKDMVRELNRNNGLFKFVRTMRERFQKAVACGVVPQVITTDQASSLITESAPVSSVSPGSRTEFPPKQKELQPGKTNRPSGEVSYDRGGKSAILSPGSASTLRRSPRIKVSSHF
ncbi:hypothetical protein LguiB_022748 [Lonicera macranthoides]